MRNSIAVTVSASHREELATVRPHMLKVDPQPQVSASELRELTLDVIRRTHGKVASAAEVLELHEAQVGRLAKEGDLKLKHLEALGVSTLALLGRELVERYGPLSTPEDRADQIIRELRQQVDELAQYVALKRGA